jgi:hypothetical protein
MKIGSLLTVSVMPVIALADDTVPQRPDFNHCRAMLNHSFAMAAVTAPAVTSGLVKGIYVTDVTCVGDDCDAMLASTSDKNFTLYIKVKRTDIQWSAPK